MQVKPTSNLDQLQKRLGEIGTSHENLDQILAAIKAVYQEFEVKRSLQSFERLIKHVS